MIIRTILVGAMLVAAWPAMAQGWRSTTEPSAKDAAERDAPPPRLGPFDGPQTPLTKKERRGVAYGRQWANNPDMPARGEDGSITFVFGSTLPTVVCAPLYVGDSVRWQITPATQGAGDATITHVIIKPTDIGLMTNLIITTDRRAYTIKLVSRAEDWMPRVSFSYPDDVRAQWLAYGRKAASAREEAGSTDRRGSADFDFGYDISGDSPRWRPVRVFASGAKTYIEFPRDIGAGDLPTLVALGDDGGLFTEPSKQLVNYRFVHGRFEVDKVLGRAALISGVGGDQVSVRIERQSQRGW